MRMTAPASRRLVGLLVVLVLAAGGSFCVLQFWLLRPVGEGPAGPPVPGEPRGGQCFVQPVALDILTEAGKVLGGAIRRYGNTVLYQGSLQLPDARTRANEYEFVIQERLAVEWGLEWETRGPDAGVTAAAKELEAKYRSAEWVRRR